MPRMQPRDLLIKHEWVGRTADGLPSCLSCERPQSGGRHAEDCAWKMSVGDQQVGELAFTRASEVEPEARGCNTCNLRDTCSAFRGYKALILAERDYFDLDPAGRPTAMATSETDALVVFSVGAEACKRWVPLEGIE